MKDSLFPARGGRVVLELDRIDAETVAYRASLFVPDARYDAAVAVRLADGDVAFDAFEPAAPPGWLVAFARAFLRSEWLARRGDEREPWPARLNRWRPAK